MEGGSASVASKQAPGRGFWGTLGGSFRWQKTKRGSNVFNLSCHKVIHVHAGRTGGVLFTLAEDIMWSAEILSKTSTTSAATRSGHDVGSLSRFNIV